jgi:hypothetical protein
LKRFIANQYQNLFLSHAGGHEEEVLECVQCRVTTWMNESMLTPFIGEEVWCALDRNGDLKAPRKDGFTVIFYKLFWQLVRERIKEEVLAILNGVAMPHGWNDTVIVHITKIKAPEKLSDLRLISLCIS